MSNKDYKEVVIDNDAIVNTEPKELPEEAHNIPQGVKPHLNPNPGYGEDGETKPAIKTDLVEGERGTPVDVVTPAKDAFKVIPEVYNFLNGLKIKGKNIEDYIDEHGGVSQDELDAVKQELDEKINDKQDKLDTTSAPAGSIAKIIGFDSNGDVVSDDVPEGIVVDETIVEDSPNAVAGGAVYTALQGKADVGDSYTKAEEDALLENKANVDGNYPTMTVGNAEQLVSTIFVNDKVPYLFRTSGGDADIGNRENDKIIGGSLAVNQRVPENKKDFTNSTTDTRTNFQLSIQFYSTPLGYYTAKSENIDTTGIKQYIVTAPNNYSDLILKHNGQTLDITFATITTPIISGHKYFISFDANSIDVNNVGGLVIKNIQFFDLSQMFGSTIADYIYSLEQANAGAGVAWFKNYFQELYYPYNTGSLLSVKLTSHDTVGFNQWDEDWEYGDINTSTGQNAGTSEDYIRSENLIRVIPNTDYYYYCGFGNVSSRVYFYDVNGEFISQGVKTFNSTLTTPENCYYIRFRFATSSYGTTYRNDICINLSWSGWRNGQYEPYKKNSYPLDTTVELRGIPKLDSNNHLYFDGDEYSSDGKVVRKYGIVDLGTLSWQWQSEQNRWLTEDLKSLIKLNQTKIPAISNYVALTYDNMGGSEYSDIIGMSYYSLNGNVFIRNGSSSTEPSGYLVYELAESTEETADTFQDPQIVDDFGTEEYVVPTQSGWKIPVGHDTKYPANLRDKLQRLPDMPSVSQNVTETYVVNYNGTTKKCTFVAIDSWLSENGYEKQVDLNSGITSNTGIIIDNVKAYKIGNVVNLTLRLTNSNDYQINADNEIFTLSSDIRPIVTLVQPVGKFYNNAYSTALININSVSGAVKTLTNLETGSYIYISLSYVVA